MSPEQVQTAREAFEDHYQSDAQDPYLAPELEIWMAAWERCVAQEGKAS